MFDSGGVAHRMLKPTLDIPRPSIPACGIVPAIVIVATGVIVVVILRRVEHNIP